MRISTDSLKTGLVILQTMKIKHVSVKNAIRLIEDLLDAREENYMTPNLVQQLERIKTLLPEGFEISLELSKEPIGCSMYAIHTSGMTPPLVWRDGHWESTGI